MGRWSQDWDVVVCGGGLAGLTLARQLRRWVPTVSVAVIEREIGPLPDAAHKVGESTVEGASAYLTQTLGLGAYLDERHLKKFGLRFFLGAGGTPLAERVEQGTGDELPIPAHQLDRGRLENDLREMCVGDGIELIQARIIDVELGDPHRVRFEVDGEERSVTTRWVVDATGRSRLLARKLGLQVPSPHHANACWWRVPEPLDVAELVPASDARWHARTPGGDRRLSTNHIMGPGYWIWVIPLATGNTSVGIVADESLHPIRERTSFDDARRWLAVKQPPLAAWLTRGTPLDYRVLRSIAHLTRQAFSVDRWACVGEAALFTDPLYSIGSDLIAWANTITTRIIQCDAEGHPADEPTVDAYNRLFLRTATMITDMYAGRYAVFGSPDLTLRKIVWDAALYWSYVASPLCHSTLEFDAVIPEMDALFERTRALNRRVQDEIVARAPGASTRSWRGFHPLNPLRSLIDIYLALDGQRRPADHLAHLAWAFEKLEELSAVLFVEAAPADGGQMAADLLRTIKPPPSGEAPTAAGAR